MVPPRQEFASTDVQSWEGLIKTINDLMKVGRRIRFDTVSEQQPQLVAHDNPYFLSERLTAHQGIFLFAGDIRRPFRENLKSMKGWHLRKNVLKLHLRFDNIKKVEAIKTLKRMNVSSTVLFPGLDGFARSLGEELPFYDEIYGEIERRARRKEMNNTPSARATLDSYR